MSVKQRKDARHMIRHNIYVNYVATIEGILDELEACIHEDASLSAAKKGLQAAQQQIAVMRTLHTDANGLEGFNEGDFVALVDRAVREITEFRSALSSVFAPIASLLATPPFTTHPKIMEGDLRHRLGLRVNNPSIIDVSLEELIKIRDAPG